jgi:prepilin signal peptidase PulO-like enzyme (type II secretory pathway)
MLPNAKSLYTTHFPCPATSRSQGHLLSLLSFRYCTVCPALDAWTPSFPHSITLFCTLLGLYINGSYTTLGSASGAVLNPPSKNAWFETNILFLVRSCVLVGRDLARVDVITILLRFAASNFRGLSLEGR